MITELREIYKCEHCRKLYQVKRFAQQHELMCVKNPDNQRACFGCKFLTKKDTVILSDHPVLGESKSTVSLCYCIEKNIYVFPPKVEIKGNEIDLVDIENAPMPTKCELRFDIDLYADCHE